MIPILSDLISPILNKILDFIPDPKQKAEALARAQEAARESQEKIMAALSQSDKSQADIDQVEASSPNLFISGWRPFLGWVCGAAFAWVYVLQPIISFGLAAAHHPVALPTLDFSQMSTVLMGMLGLAGLRTYEKRTDTESNR